MKEVAREVGLPLGDRKMSFNTRLAQELAKWAESKGRGDAFHEAVFRAYYVSGKNIGKKETLVNLAKSIGLEEKEARLVLQERSYKEAVDSDYSRCYELGITAVPTFRINGNHLVGAQPYDVLESFLKSHGVKERKA